MATYITEIVLNRAEVYGISLRMTLDPLSFWMKDELGAQVAVDPVHRIVDDVHMILQPSLAVESCVKITVEIAPGHRI